MDWWITFDQQAADYLPDLRIAKEEPMDRHTSFRIGGRPGAWPFRSGESSWCCCWTWPPAAAPGPW